MTDTTISRLADHVDSEVRIKGWLYNKRGSGKIAFLQLRDGTGMTQGIVVKSDNEELFSTAEKVTIESSVIVTGTVSKHPKKDEYELQVSDIEIVHLNDDSYPIGKKEHGPDFLLDHRHLWLRSKRQWAIMRVRDRVITAIYEYFHQNDFIKIDSPIFTPNACEGTTELFEVVYFDTKTYLTQSGQLYLEAAIMSHGRVFDFGPVFRAEKSKTRRHLTEFWMMNAEMAFCDNEQNMDIQEGLVCYIVEQVLKHNQAELALLERDTAELEAVKAPFYRVTHKEAVDKMQQLKLDAAHDDDFGADEEITFANEYDRPVFVTNYPAKVKAFYMKEAENDDIERVYCSDLLVPRVGEIIGGSQREDDHDILLRKINEHKLPVDQFEWYLDLRKYGSVPHSGFGIGLERTVGWICGIHHIRETIPFPRLINRIHP